jgi:hypothetical protein
MRCGTLASAWSRPTGQAVQPFHEVSCGEVFDMHRPDEVLMHVPHITATETIRRHV